LKYKKGRLVESVFFLLINELKPEFIILLIVGFHSMKFCMTKSYIEQNIPIRG